MSNWKDLQKTLSLELQDGWSVCLSCGQPKPIYRMTETTCPLCHMKLCVDCLRNQTKCGNCIRMARFRHKQ